MKQKIETEFAPPAIGVYSQAIQDGDLIFVSGQLPIDPSTGQFPSENVSDQTEQSLNNLKAILEAAGYGMDRVVKTTVLLADIADFGEMNEVYSRFFTVPYPARWSPRRCWSAGSGGPLPPSAPACGSAGRCPHGRGRAHPST